MIMFLSKKQIHSLNNTSVSESIKKLVYLFPEQVYFSTSLGQEDQVITDIICRNNFPVKLFTLDTGRLFNETYKLIEKTESKYKIKIQVYYPDTKKIEEYVDKNGINGFFKSIELRKNCCFIRKVEPLQRALKGAKIWITGLRAGQSSERVNLSIFEWHSNYEVYKYNPLLNWSYDELLSTINKNNIPYNVLHDNNYISVGCAPCTRPIQDGEDIRSGRWWWEDSHKECGLHIHNQNK